MFVTLILLIIMLFFSAFFSGSETSLFSLGKYDVSYLSTSDDASDRRIIRLLKDHRKLLLTVLIGNMFVNIGSSALSETLFTRLFGPGGLTISVIVMTTLILIFGEVTPKAVAIKYPRYISRIVAPFIQFFSVVLYPFSEIFSFIAHKILGFLDITKKRKTAVTPEEVKTAILIAQKEKVLHPFEGRVIGGILNLKKKTIENIMRPRNAIVALDGNVTVKEGIAYLKKKRYSRIPVYRGDLDHIEGMLYVKDLATNSYVPETSISSLSFLRKPLFVPEMLSVIQLVHTFNKEQVHIAVVLDEYGGVSGVVTYEDVFEEIIGEVRDKEDRVPEFRKIGKNMYEIQAHMELRQFNELCDTELEDPYSNTIGGFIITKIGRIPDAGEAYRYNNILFKIMSARKNKIEKIMVSVLPYRKRR